MAALLSAALTCPTGAIWAQDETAQYETAQYETALGKTGQPKSYLSLGAAYSERYKQTLSADLMVGDLFNKGIALRFSGAQSKGGYRLSADLNKTVARTARADGGGPVFNFGVDTQVQAWQDSAYQTRRTGFSASAAWYLNQGRKFEATYKLHDSRISNVAAITSPLIAAESGKDISSGISLSFGVDRTDHPFLPRQGYYLSASADLYGLGGDAKWTGLSVNAGYFTPFVGNSRLGLKTTAGKAQGYGGYAMKVTDRAFMGYSLPRGFGYGGIGPRDTNGTISTALGGESFVGASLQLSAPVHEMASGTLEVFTFVDAGSVWDLARTTGGFLPKIDDSFYLRTSVGGGVSWIGAHGELSLIIANPIRMRSQDEKQLFSIDFKTRF